MLFCWINYTLTDAPESCTCLYAQFRRTNPELTSKFMSILNGISVAGDIPNLMEAWGAGSRPEAAVQAGQ
ncbi:hypothetical protein GGD63_007963 [Bradyrhizobium sp. cir1]|nr:hypothetical protein [Bradyrhizobium sp. cir1]